MRAVIIISALDSTSVVLVRAASDILVTVLRLVAAARSGLHSLPVLYQVLKWEKEVSITVLCTAWNRFMPSQGTYSGVVHRRPHADSVVARVTAAVRRTCGTGLRNRKVAADPVTAVDAEGGADLARCALFAGDLAVAVSAYLVALLAVSTSFDYECRGMASQHTLI